MPTRKKRSNSKTNSLNSSLFKLPNGSIYNQPGQYRSTAAIGSLGGGSGNLPAKKDGTNPILSALQALVGYNPANPPQKGNYPMVDALGNAISSAGNAVSSAGDAIAFGAKKAVGIVPWNAQMYPSIAPSPQELMAQAPQPIPNPYQGGVTRDSVLTGSYIQPSMAYSPENISIAPPPNTSWRGGVYTGTIATQQTQPNQMAFTQENYNKYGTGRGYKRWWIGSGGNSGRQNITRGSNTQDPISGFSINWRVGAG